MGKKDIYDFFGKKGNSTAKKPEGSPGKGLKREVEEESEGEDEIIKAPAKRRRRPAASSKKAKKEEESDDDIKIEDAPPPPKTNKGKASKGKGSTTAAAPPGEQSGKTAEEVLASIPDAELPEVDGSKKFNYHEFKAKQAEAGQPSGSIDIPVAQENCLAGLSFVFTGTLPNLGRDQGQDIVKRYGGKVMSAPSKNTSCVVLGAEAGPKKIQTIKEKHIKAIEEDGFLELLRKMPADGGGGEAALKAKEKQAKEQEKIEQEAAKMSKEFEEREKQEQQKQKQQEPKKKSKASQEPPSSSPPRDANKEQLWTTKYAPTSLNQICGNKGAVEKLNKWLANWKTYAKQGFKTPGPDGSGIFRAAILHGPPGIGKTTAAHIIAESHGYDVIENNASDTRSKGLLAKGIGRRLNSTSLAGYFGEAESSKKNVCLIMDEVDGMSGGDRGGVGQMAAMCRTSNVPLILVCNERSLPKLRPFDRVTFDIPFRRPDANQIRARVMSICHREGLKVNAQVVDQLCQSTRSDIRQIINMLSTYARTENTMDFDQSKDLSKQWEKHSVLRPFDIIGRYMSPVTFAPSSNISLNDKIEIYFHDHDFTPLMVQENYLNTIPRGTSTNLERLDMAAQAAESISDGDLVDRAIMGQQQWSLMPLHAVLSSVRPSYFVAGQGRGRFNFTSFLGNLSKGNKYNRLLQEIQSHARMRISGNKDELRTQYLSLLTYKLLQPLLKEGADGVAEVIDTMDSYFLTKEDWDVIMELAVGSNKAEEKAKSLPTAVKSGFTRKYNASDHPVPFMKSADQLAPKKVGSEPAPDIDDIIEQDADSGEQQQDEEADKDDSDDITKDKYIKAAKPTKSKAATKKATTSKKKTSKK